MASRKEARVAANKAARQAERELARLEKIAARKEAKEEDKAAVVAARQEARESRRLERQAGVEYHKEKLPVGEKRFAEIEKLSVGKVKLM